MGEYIGLDVSLKETALSVRRDGKRVWRGRCESDPAVIARVLRKHAPEAKRVVFETGPLSVWFNHALRAEGLPAICIMTIPGVGQLTALAFTAAVDDPERFRRSRDVGPYLGLVPRRYQSGEVDYTGSISKCGDRRVRTLLYEAANVMLTRCRRPLKLKDWALAIAQRSTMRKARIALARRLAIIMHAMLRQGTEFKPA